MDYNAHFRESRKKSVVYLYLVASRYRCTTEVVALLYHRLGARWLLLQARKSPRTKSVVQPIPLGVTFSKAQSSKLESLVCHISGKRDVRDMSFELWNSNRKCHPKSMKEPRKMSLQVEFAVCIVFIELRIGGTSISSCNKQESATSKKVTSLLDLIQPIADRVARISRLFLKPFQRTRILPMGFTISTN